MQFRIYSITGIFRRKDTLIVLFFMCTVLWLLRGEPTTAGPKGIASLSKRGRKNGDENADIIVYRVVGNNIPGYHEHGFAREMVTHIIENEWLPTKMRRRWLLWHIADQKAKLKVMTLLDEHDEEYTDIPFDLDEFAALPVREDAINDITNLHRLPDLSKFTYREMLGYYSARYSYVWGTEGTAASFNYMIDHVFRPEITKRKVEEVDEHEPEPGSEFVDLLKEQVRPPSKADWVLPVPLNIFLDQDTAQTILREAEKLKTKNHVAYVVVEGTREGEEEIDAKQRGSQKAMKLQKPSASVQPPKHVMFRRSSRTQYNPDVRYFWDNGVGELIHTVGADTKKASLPLDDIARPVSEEESQGLVTIPAKLKEAVAHLRKEVPEDVIKYKSINALIATFEVNIMRKTVGFDQKDLLTFEEDILKIEKRAYTKKSSKPLTELIDKLIDMADIALTLKPFSVTDKLETPPSGDKHDYYTPAPYYWPNLDNPKGPYIVRDGERIPGTGLYDEQCEKFDRSRLSSFFGNTTTLALAWYFTDDERYAEHAASNIRAWFVDKETRMNPHMKFAQLRTGHKKDIINGGFQSGIIETKDLYFVLDTVRLIHRSGKLSAAEYKQVQTWTGAFLKYLTTKNQGVNERKSRNNHGTYYDVQVAALAAFADDVVLFRRQMERSRARVIDQFAIDGSMPDEMKRPTQLHYMLFSLQGWYTLATLATKAGIDIYGFVPPAHKAPVLRNAAIFTVPYFNETWTHHQTEEEDMERMLPLYFMARRQYPDLTVVKSPGRSLYEANPRFDEHAGIGIFWNLGLYDCTMKACV